MQQMQGQRAAAAAAALPSPSASLLTHLPLFRSLLSHSSRVRDKNYSFSSLLPVILKNFCLSASHQGTARACPSSQPLQDKWLVKKAHIYPQCKGAFEFKSRSHLRVLWLKEQPRQHLSGLVQPVKAGPQSRRQSWGISTCPTRVKIQKNCKDWISFKTNLFNAQIKKLCTITLPVAILHVAMNFWVTDQL